MVFDHSQPVVRTDTCGILRAVRSTIYVSGLIFFVNPGVNFMVFVLSASIIIGMMQAAREMNKGSV